MKKFLLFLSLTCAAVAQVTIDWADVEHPASIGAIADLVPAANKVPLYTGTNTAALLDVSTFWQGVLDDLTQSGAQTSLGLGTSSAVTHGSLKAGGTGGVGYIEAVAQGAAPAAPANGYRLYADASGRLSWLPQSDGYARTIAGALTASRVYTLPDAAGTVLLDTATQTLTNKDLSAASNTYRAASTSTTGAVQLATTAEALAGTTTTKVAPVASAETRTLAGDATRQVVDYWLSDGATSGRAGVATPGAPGNLAGLPATIDALVYVPTTNPALNAYVFYCGPSSGPEGAYSLGVLFRSAGGFRIVQNGASQGVDQRYMDSATFRSTYAGRWVRLQIIFPAGDSTTSPVVYADGVDISPSFTPSTVGTAPNWMPMALDCTKYVVGYNWPAGPAPLVSVGPGAWNAAEAIACAQTGQQPTWWSAGTGSGANRITGDSYNFAGGVGGWTASAGGTATVTADPANAELDVATTAINAYAIVQAPITTGHRYRVVVTLRNIVVAGGALVRGQVSGGAANNTFITGVAVDGTYIGEFTATGPGTGILFVQFGGTSANWSIYQPQIYDLGPVAKWIVQRIPVAADTGANVIPMTYTGMTGITARRDWVIQAQTTTNGNQQLLGTSAFLATNAHRIDSWVINNKGASSRTVSLGNASGGAQFASGTTCAPGLTDITLLTRWNATANLWTASDGTDLLQHTITGHKVD